MGGGGSRGGGGSPAPQPIATPAPAPVQDPKKKIRRGVAPTILTTPGDDLGQAANAKPTLGA